MQTIFTRLAILPLFLFMFQSHAQTDWTPIFLTASGHHIVNGVEAYFAKEECEGEAVVFIKFVNTNGYPVNLTWYNAVFTTNLTWVHHSNDTQTLTVPASTTIEGVCQGGEAVLKVNLNDFITDASTFKRLTTVHLTIAAAN